MKLDLMESGLQNIRQIASQYSKAKIYFHMDLDGVTSAIAMKEYLKRYGIQTVDCQKIQYGSMEYSILKPTSDDILPVLVDFAHGKAFMKIHTDHHDKQIQYQNTSNQFRHAKSNAETLSSVVSVSDIFPKEDIRIINMIDSAGYKDENVNPWDMLRATIKVDKSQDTWKNHLQMGMAAGKLLLSYKNKPEFLETIVLKSAPSLMSMYQVMMNIIGDHLKAGDRGWVSPEVIDKNSKDYYERQSDRKIPEAKVDDIKEMTNGQSALIGDVIFQIGGGSMTKTGSFDRYTAFRLYPNAKYFIMLWHTIGMMQVSKNPWGDDSNKDVHLGHVVMDDIFKQKYVPLLNKPKYDISLLAIKMAFEEKITPEIEGEAVGFDFNELVNLFEKDYSDLTEKQRVCLEKCVDFKPSQFIPEEGNDKKNDIIRRVLNNLALMKMPLAEIVEKQSGGHPGITNISGFNFLDMQQRIERKLKYGKNPYVKEKSSYKPSKKDDEEQHDSTSTKILKSIAQDVVKKLNSMN